MLTVFHMRRNATGQLLQFICKLLQYLLNLPKLLPIILPKDNKTLYAYFSSACLAFSAL